MINTDLCADCEGLLTEDNRVNERRLCKPCRQKRRKDPSSKLFRSDFMANARRYGLDPDDVWLRYTNHSGLCDICGSPPRGNRSVRLYIDHDHKTLTFRGFICYHCNVMLGHAGDDPTILGRAITYLLDNEGTN